MLLVKYSQDGTRLWAKRYDGTGDSGDGANSLRARPGGGVYVCGHTTSVDTGVDGLFLAYTGAGTPVFAATDDGASDESTQQVFHDLEVMPGGDIICGGHDYRSGADQDRHYVVFTPAGAVRYWVWWSTEWDERITALAKDEQGGIYLTGTGGTATGTQVFTERTCDGGSYWHCQWPASPTTYREPTAIAVNGVNAYVVGSDYSGATAEFVMGHVY